MVYSSSLEVNPVTSDIGLSPQGSNYLWALFGIFSLALLILAFITHSRRKHHRAFHYLAMAILAVTVVHYAAQASNLGYASVPVEWIRSGSRGAFQVLGGAPIPPTRSIFYSKWVGYAITMPLLVLLLLLATGFTLSRIFITLFFTLLWVVCFLIAALIPTRYKWTFFTLGTVSLLYVLWNVVHPGSRSARTLGREYHRGYSGHAFALAFLFLLYPIAWGLSEGGNVVRVASEMFWYGVLDFFTKVVWLFSFLFTVEGLDYGRFGFHSGKYTDTQHAGNGAYGPGPGGNAHGDMAQRGAGGPGMAGPGGDAGGPPPVQGA
ncbi:plasma membrane heat shock protein [Rhodotorula kratochvilovae]